LNQDSQNFGRNFMIGTHREAVEEEYQLVLKQAGEICQYLENRNCERFARIEAMGPPHGKKELWKKIQSENRLLGLI